MTTREEAILWLSSFEKNKEPMTLIPKQLIRLMYEALTEQPEIVRCKDCRYWDKRTDGCGHLTGTIAPIVKTHADWFCADGE